MLKVSKFEYNFALMELNQTVRTSLGATDIIVCCLKTQVKYKSPLLIYHISETLSSFFATTYVTATWHPANAKLVIDCVTAK